MNTQVTAERYHDICFGHRVTGHENKCGHLHGHNYRFYFEVEPVGDLDNVGRVVDFSVMKSTLCEWLERNYDHKFIIWEQDPHATLLKAIDPDGVLIISYNPTAENIALNMVENVGPEVLAGTGCRLVRCTVQETRKCSATATLTK